MLSFKKRADSGYSFNNEYRLNLFQGEPSEKNVTEHRQF
jgi:hypothetical protein